MIYQNNTFQNRGNSKGNKTNSTEIMAIRGKTITSTIIATIRAFVNCVVILDTVFGHPGN